MNVFERNCYLALIVDLRADENKNIKKKKYYLVYLLFSLAFFKLFYYYRFYTVYFEFLCHEFSICSYFLLYFAQIVLLYRFNSINLN